MEFAPRREAVRTLVRNAVKRESVTSNQQSDRVPAAPPEPFEHFWGVVHSKAGKRAAKSAYCHAVKRLRVERPDTDPDQFLFHRMAAFAKTPAANPPDRTPIHPATWLNQGRYDDDPATWARGSPANNSASDPRGNLALRKELLAEMEQK